MKIQFATLLTVFFSLALSTHSIGQVPDDINGRLWRLAKVWGMAKYFHPDNCTVDWNTLLIESIDSILVSSSNAAFNDILLEMLLAPGTLEDPGYPLVISADINKNAIFTWKEDELLSQPVRDVLDDIVEYFRPANNCFVIQNTQSDPDYVGYLSFTHDNLNTIQSFTYEDEAHRLAALFYYWNIINYFNPNNALMDQPWDTTLLQFIPLMREAKNDTAFHIRFLNLVTYINDTHGFTFSPLIDNHLGQYYPVLAIKEIEGQSVVVKVDTANAALSIGDVIRKIDGIEIEFWFDSLKHFSPASNTASLTRDLHLLVLAGDANSVMEIEFENEAGETHVISLNRSVFIQDYYAWLYEDPKPTWEITDCGYGYINMGKLTTSLVPIVLTALRNTPAIIFDVRNYPNGTLWSLMPRLFPSPVTWALLPVPDLTFPGWYTWANNQFDAGNFTNPQAYFGEVIILANEETQSQAEYTVMGLQQHPKAFTIGSQTAGADGNISNLVLPGDLYTYWSTLGVYYPDTTDTQRTGVRIDSIVEPTIEDVRLGRDRVLRAALDCLSATADSPVALASAQVYPNPAVDVVYVAPDNLHSSFIQVEVVNATGQFVYSQILQPQGSHPISIDVKHWPGGIYTIQLIADNKFISAARFIKL